MPKGAQVVTNWNNYQWAKKENIWIYEKGLLTSTLQRKFKEISLDRWSELLREISFRGEFERGQPWVTFINASIPPTRWTITISSLSTYVNECLHLNHVSPYTIVEEKLWCHDLHISEVIYNDTEATTLPENVSATF